MKGFILAAMQKVFLQIFIIYTRYLIGAAYVFASMPSIVYGQLPVSCF